MKMQKKPHVTCSVCETKYTFAGSVGREYTCPKCGTKNKPKGLPQ